MKLEINEEELEFLLRICTRAEMFASMQNFTSPYSKDSEKIKHLLDKLKNLEKE
ncbi:hypothetical protein UFOVP844_37 [uncultured Caudovirales phage]|uniref:Uncharacterized protein n=1 Tax=uncultured Caudovirales phage TaxID=2100421 RepID=A0A6J5PBV8_9CAUD|nr:hypothetical protein UFOVP844_37 [uncultured Caudovirales phage]